jgi:hypothetical protein
MTHLQRGLLLPGFLLRGFLLGGLLLDGLAAAGRGRFRLLLGGGLRGLGLLLRGLPGGLRGGLRQRLGGGLRSHGAGAAGDGNVGRPLDAHQVPDEAHRAANGRVVGALHDVANAAQSERPQHVALLGGLPDLAADLADAQHVVVLGHCLVPVVSSRLRTPDGRRRPPG